jgi:hypothetical protein
MSRRWGKVLHADHMVRLSWSVRVRIACTISNKSCHRKTAASSLSMDWVQHEPVPRLQDHHLGFDVSINGAALSRLPSSPSCSHFSEASLADNPNRAGARSESATAHRICRKSSSQPFRTEQRQAFRWPYESHFMHFPDLRDE